MSNEPDDLRGLAAHEAALFDIEPVEVPPLPPRYWHDTFPSYRDATMQETLPNLFVVVRVFHADGGYGREAFATAGTSAEAQRIVEKFRPLMPGNQWDVTEYVPLPF